MQAVIVAAGESSRFWPLNNGIHKSQFKLLGKSLIYWTLKGLVENGITNIMIVVGKDSSMQAMLDQENDLGVTIAYGVQEEPLGTGNALWKARDFIKEPFILLWGNKIGSKDLVTRLIAKQSEGVDAVFVGMEVENPAEYGMLQLQGEKVLGIVEKPEPGKEPSRFAAAGARLLTPEIFSYYEKLSDYHEVDLTDATNEYLKDKSAFVLVSDEKGLTLKYPWDAFASSDFLFASEHFQPHIAETAHVAGNVVIKGPVYIGDNVVIKEGTIIEGPVYIGADSTIGYYNVIRGPVDLERGCRTGAFMEIKESLVQEGSIFHSGYVGNSIIGKNCRFGAGFVTGNLRLDRQPIYGLSKLGVIMGDDVAFGIHAGTMPGVVIGNSCKIGPNTHVFENLQDRTTFYSKQENIQK